MSFDWMESNVPSRVKDRGPQARRDAYTREIRERAALLRRLGHDHDYALHRCLSNLEWSFERSDQAPISADDVRAVVKAVYSK